MKEQIEKVGEFHKSFQIEENVFFDNIPHDTINLRYSLGLEELNEYKEACDKEDKEGIADALADQLYILLGTIRIHGMSDIIEDVFAEVHSSNMSKLDDFGVPILNGINCELDTTRPYGKVLKSKNFREPNFKHLL